MNEDNSSQAILFRLRKGIGSSEHVMKNYKGNCLQMYGRPYLSSLGKVPTIIGKRNGIPIGSDQDYFQRQRNIMNKRHTRPFKSNEMRDIAPTIYNGNVNILAGTGGAPLAFALDDESELQERLYSEGIRGSSSNPLSARFAINAHQNREPPVIGGATDIMRRELSAHEDDEATMGRKLHSGYLGNIRKQSAFLTAESTLDPEIEAFKNQMRPPTRKDFLGHSSQLQATVEKIHKTTAAQITGLDEQLKKLNTRSRNHQTTLTGIYDIMNSYQPAGAAVSLAPVVPTGSVTMVPFQPPGHVAPVAQTPVRTSEPSRPPTMDPGSRRSARPRALRIPHDA